MGLLKHRRAKMLRARADAVNPAREPVGIHFGPEGSAPPGTKLHVITGPKGSTTEDLVRELDKMILSGQVEIGGCGKEDDSKEAVAARWKERGWTLPDDPAYIPDAFDLFYERLSEQWRGKERDPN